MRLLRPDSRDLRVIGFYLGRVSTGLALLMAAPAVLGLDLGEWNAAAALLAGAGMAASLGQLAAWRLATRAPLTLAHGTVVVAAAWLLGSLLVSVPLLLSGHFDGLLDAWFEAMSGLTTSGLSLAQDLDHLAYSMNLYRHLTHFVGGQGIVIVVLALLAAGSGLGSLYSAEGRDERIVPSVVRTARFIFRVALVYALLGTAALTAAVHAAGIGGWRALWHGTNLFVAAFDTGGFTPTSQSVGYYHSPVLEAALLVLMLAGTLSFAVHYRLWLGRHRDPLEDLEVRTLAVSILVLTAVVLFALVRAGTHIEVPALVRRGGFTLVSAHTGTGFAVVDGRLLLSDWPVLAVSSIVVAMALGGMAGSTAGGIKAIRLGLAAKAVVHDIRRLLAPESALTVTSYRAGRRRILRDRDVRAAMTVLLLYVVLYLSGAAVALVVGPWSAAEAVFESVSAAANVGLTIGIVGPEMPAALKATYIVQMWLGRLEFFAVLALVGYAVSLLRGRA